VQARVQQGRVALVIRRVQRPSGASRGNKERYCLLARRPLLQHVRLREHREFAQVVFEHPLLSNDFEINVSDTIFVVDLSSEHLKRPHAHKAPF
jgi:hypothetical protein